MSIDLRGIEVNEYNYESDEEIEEYSEEPEPESEPSDDEVKALVRKRLILKMYLNEFPEKLKSYSRMKNKIDSMESNELDKLRQEFELCVGMKTSIKGMTGMAMKSILMLEKTIEIFTPLNPSGLATLCANDENFNDDLKLVCLKYCEYMNASPEIRLGMSLVSNIVMLDKVNKMKTTMLNNPETQEKIGTMQKGMNELNNMFDDI